MKDFEKLVKKTLETRKKIVKERKEAAEDAIAKAIQMFNEPNVESVYIDVYEDSHNKVIIYPVDYKGKIGEVCSGLNIFDEVVNILSSEDSKIKPYLYISMDSIRIQLELKENTWTKKGGIFPPFFVYIRKLNTEQKFWFFIKKYWQNEKKNIK